MSTIALKAVIVPGTGTGKSYSAYDLRGPIAVFREDSPAGAPGIIAMKRTEPKVTKDYAGANRGEVKLTRQVADSLGRLWPEVITITTSIPAFRTDAEKLAFVTEGLLLAQESASIDVLSKLVVPQS